MSNSEKLHGVELPLNIIKIAKYLRGLFRMSIGTFFRVKTRTFQKLIF
jgi:hypothetical protein